MLSLHLRPQAPLRNVSLAALALVLAISTSCLSEEHPAQPASLPDAPSAIVAASSATSSSLAEPSYEAEPSEAEPSAEPDPGGFPKLWGNSGSKTRVVRPHVKLVQVGKISTPQTVGDKMYLSVRESITPFAMLGWTFSSGWSHLINSSPNYGTNGQAFAQRLGAAAALNSSKEIFSDGVLASAFHQDPRYYRQGNSHTIAHRAVYAATRVIVGRTDGGRVIPNYAFILGTGGAAALTHTYYPEQNVNPRQVMQTWGTSLGGSAVGNLVSEFGGDLIRWLRVTTFE